MRYRLDVVADHPDDRPLQILGVAVLDLEEALATAGQRPPPQTLAAAADLFDCDSRFLEHRLSAPARAFKAKALAAAGVSQSSTEPTEIFRSRVMSGPLVGADLVPAG